MPLLVQHFIRAFSRGQPVTLSARAWAALADYAFPGNVRELEHAIHHGIVLAKGGEVDLPHLPSDIAGVFGAEAVIPAAPFRTMAVAVAEFECEYVLRAMRAAGGKKTLAASLLGISRKTLWERLRSMPMDPELRDAVEDLTDPGTKPPRSE